MQTYANCNTSGTYLKRVALRTPRLVKLTSLPLSVGRIHKPLRLYIEPSHLHSAEKKGLQFRLAAGHNRESYKWNRPNAAIETILQDKPTIFRLHQVFSHAQNTVSGGSTGGCRMALEQSGLFCFVPNDTKIRDLVCQFESSNILAILRRGRKVIGRAVNFLLSTPNELVGI